MNENIKYVSQSPMEIWGMLFSKNVFDLVLKDGYTLLKLTHEKYPLRE